MKDFNSEDLFDIVRVAHTDWKNGRRVLIRCQAGWNRSGLITALVLIREGYSARDAIDMQRKRRSEWVLCNEHFERWLLKTDANDWKGNAYGKDK
jgi:protein-tyrosine phosphatase